jgi:hypothetical protein
MSILISNREFPSALRCGDVFFKGECRLSKNGFSIIKGEMYGCREEDLIGIITTGDFQGLGKLNGAFFSSAI